jgi:hypothetical protein
MSYRTKDALEFILVMTAAVFCFVSAFLIPIFLIVWAAKVLNVAT